MMRTLITPTVRLFMVALAFCSVGLLAASPDASAVAPSDSSSPTYLRVCDEKQRADVCRAKVSRVVREKCKKKTGSAKTACEERESKKAAKPFKAKTTSSSTTAASKPGSAGRYQCGTGDNAIKTKFNFGCLGDNYSEGDISAIQDLFYSFVRFLSAGVGILVVASIIYAGIQYSSSQGNPEATQAAKGRIQNSIIALVIYMFIFALVQFLVPGGLFA